MNLLVSDELENMPDGKRRLVVAALKLAARDGVPLNALGLRELAREAELNHNTFYRHFENLDDLARSTIEIIAQTIIDAMGTIRSKAASHADATEGLVNFFLDLVLRNPDAFTVGVREINTAFSPLRPLLVRVIDDIAKQSVVQIQAMNLVPLKDTTVFLEVAREISMQMFSAAVPLIKSPQQKKAIAEKLVQSIRRQFLGALAMESMKGL
ncbi:MAG: TetR family transcriptional regulator [Limnobacter sp.]|uniref:TetR/AcrR family transcriptional regulator n=1 Tax=Limnobacter sp. TaxID=2003368 RepID=UPI0022BCFDF8|nr:TetR family transcriptional regulator [Limnobacter sp.]MCZ8014804.1 TetR family transcriptional regulator [Limnobacter sp.]